MSAVPRPSQARRRAQQGMALAAAIGILVILAALGAFVVSVTGLRDQSAALDILGARALYAARAGIEWTMSKVNSPETASPGTPADCTTLTPVNLAPAGQLAGFTVTVNCSRTTHTEAGNSIRIYEMTAVACNFPNPGTGDCPNNASTNPSYTERSITAIAGTCRVGPAAGDAICGTGP